jgi:hypothetical protein
MGFYSSGSSCCMSHSPAYHSQLDLKAEILVSVGTMFSILWSMEFYSTGSSCCMSHSPAYHSQLDLKSNIFVSVGKIFGMAWSRESFVFQYLVPIMAYLKKTIFEVYLVDCLLFGDRKCYFRNEPLNTQKNAWNKLISDFSSGSKSTWKSSQGKIDFP